MSDANIFSQTIAKKKARLEELANNPSGKRFLHHTILGVPDTLRSSIPYTIVKYGLLTLQDRKSNPETSFKSSNTWDGECYQPVFLMDDSYNSFRVGSEGVQMMTLLVDPVILKTMKHYKTTTESNDLFDAYDGEYGISESIEPEHILGAIVPEEGHNALYYLQARPDRNPEELEREDKTRYNSFDGTSRKGKIWEEDEKRHIVGIDSFYRGLVWGMKDAPENSFPVFTGFHSSHFPYEAGGVWQGQKTDSEQEIPLEYYLASQIFPLTQEAYLGQVFTDIAKKRGMTPRQIGISIRASKGLITPEEALGRELTFEEGELYSKVNPNYRQKTTPEPTPQNYSDKKLQEKLRDFENGDVFERRRILKELSQ